MGDYLCEGGWMVLSCGVGVREVGELGICVGFGLR